MRKFFLSAGLCLLCLTQGLYGEPLEDLKEFDDYIRKHESHIDIGTGLAIAGISLFIAGGGFTSYALSVENEQYNPYKQEFMITGYTLLGIGIVSFLIGMPIWFMANKDYLETLNLRQQYYFLTRE